MVRLVVGSTVVDDVVEPRGEGDGEPIEAGVVVRELGDPGQDVLQVLDVVVAPGRCRVGGDHVVGMCLRIVV